jgi:hypothetical protein
VRRGRAVVRRGGEGPRHLGQDGRQVHHASASRIPRRAARVWDCAAAREGRKAGPAYFQKAATRGNAARGRSSSAWRRYGPRTTARRRCTR